MSRIDEWYDNALEFYEGESSVEIPEDVVQEFTTRFYNLSMKEHLNQEEVSEFEDIISIFILYNKVSLLDRCKITPENDIIYERIFDEFKN